MSGAYLAPPGVVVDNRAEYFHVFDIYLPIALGVFALFCVLIVGFALRGRARAPEQAARWHEHNPLEGAYAALLVGVVAFLLWVTFSAEHSIDSASLTEHPKLTIEVTASKWEWTFTYAGPGITARSGAGGHQPLVVPIGEPVRFRIRSVDVIHSFWIPEIGFKRDAIPGRTQVAVLEFDHTGRFVGRCAEFCGLLHEAMWFPVEVLPASRFATWIADEEAR